MCVLYTHTDTDTDTYKYIFYLSGLKIITIIRITMLTCR